MSFYQVNGPEATKKKILSILYDLSKKRTEDDIQGTYFGISVVFSAFDNSKEAANYRGRHRLGSYRVISRLLNELTKEKKAEKVRVEVPGWPAYYFRIST